MSREGWGAPRIVVPPDMELWLTGWLREKLVEAGIDASVGTREPREADYPLTRPIIVVRDDGGPQTGWRSFERSVGVAVYGGTRSDAKPVIDLARRIYALCSSMQVVTADGSPVAAVDQLSGSNGIHRVQDDADVTVAYMAFLFRVAGEVDWWTPEPPPTGRLTFNPSPLTLEFDEDATVTVTADGAPVPFDEALVSVGPDGVIEVYGSGGSGVWTVEAVAEGVASVAVSWTDPDGRSWEGVLPVTVEPAPAPLVFEAHPDVLSMDEGETVGPVTFTLDGEPFPASSVAWETTGGHVRVSVTPDGTGCMVEGLTATGADGYSITFTPVNFAAEPATVTGIVYEPCQLIDYGESLTGVAGESVTVAASGPSGVMFLEGPGSSLVFEPASVGRVTVADPIQATVFLDAPGEALLTLTGLVGQGEGAVMGRARVAVTVAVPLDTVPGGGWTQQPGSRWEVEIRRGETQLGFADVTMTADTPGVMTMVPVRDGAGLGLHADETATAGTVTCLFTHTHEGVLYGARFTVTLDPTLAGLLVLTPPDGLDMYNHSTSVKLIAGTVPSSPYAVRIEGVPTPPVLAVEHDGPDLRVTAAGVGEGVLAVTGRLRDEQDEWTVMLANWPFVVAPNFILIPDTVTMEVGGKYVQRRRNGALSSRYPRTITPAGSLSMTAAGNVTANTVGTAVIAVTDISGTESDECAVTVLPAGSITPLECVNGTTVNVQVGEIAQLAFTCEGTPVPGLDIAAASTTGSASDIRVTRQGAEYVWTVEGVVAGTSRTYVFAWSETIPGSSWGGAVRIHNATVTFTCS